MAASWLNHVFGDEIEVLSLDIAQRVGIERWRKLLNLLKSDLPQPQTSSIGRLFDALASLLGICHFGAYEGHPAIWLEMEAAKWVRGAECDERCGVLSSECNFEQLPFTFELTDSQPIVMKAEPVIKGIVNALKRGEPAEKLAALFHAAVADGTLRAFIKIRERTGISEVVLSGGVMQNVLLLGWLVPLIEQAGFSVFVPTKLPPNDGGICFGQAAIAANWALKSVAS